jgi:hypothetical protein
VTLSLELFFLLEDSLSFLDDSLSFLEDSFSFLEDSLSFLDDSLSFLEGSFSFLANRLFRRAAFFAISSASASLEGSSCSWSATVTLIVLLIKASTLSSTVSPFWSGFSLLTAILMRCTK